MEGIGEGGPPHACLLGCSSRSGHAQLAWWDSPPGTERVSRFGQAGEARPASAGLPMRMAVEGALWRCLMGCRCPMDSHLPGASKG